MAWEKFTQTGKSYRAKITIRLNGQLGFNFGAIEKFRLVNFPYAVLFYDTDTKRIGIKLTKNKEEAGACKLRVRNSNASIAAKSFLDYYSISYAKSRRFDAELDEKEDMIIAKIG